MPLDINRTSINVNGIPVPGLSRNGQFLSEAPVESYLLHRTTVLTANAAKSFIIDYSCIIEFVVCIDTNANTNFTFTITSPENVAYAITVPSVSTVKLGDTRIITLPNLPIDKRSTISVLSSNNISQLGLYTKPIVRLDTIEF